MSMEWLTLGSRKAEERTDPVISTQPDKCRPSVLIPGTNGPTLADDSLSGRVLVWARVGRYHPTLSAVTVTGQPLW